MSKAQILPAAVVACFVALSASAAQQTPGQSTAAARPRRTDREYLKEEQRRPRGCIAGRMQLAFHHGLLASSH